MPTVSAKRQITLPIEQCRQLDIEPGDEVTTFVYDGHITIVKKSTGSAKGRLDHLRARTKDSDAASLKDALSKRATRK